MLQAVGENEHCSYSVQLWQGREMDVLSAGPIKFTNCQKGSVVGAAGNPPSRQNTSLLPNHPKKSIKSSHTS